MQYYQITCFNCGNVTTQDKIETTCNLCNGPLDITYNRDEQKQRINRHLLRHSPISSYKYLDFYPLNKVSHLVSLNEGTTPLYHLQKIMPSYLNLYVKYEGANPTGAFKDRGSFVELNKAKEMSASAVVVASTGNMAASVSAYASQLEIPCYVFIPEGTPPGKLAQAIAYGAKVIQVRGTYNDAQKMAEEAAVKFGFFLCGDYAYRAEGQKSIAYEIIEQLEWTSPDWIIVPVGMGTNIAGIYKGFKEFFELGYITKLPHFVAVQAEGAAAAVNSYNSNSQELVPEPPKTVCSAIAVGKPLDYPKVKHAINDSNGLAVTVSDSQALQAEKQLADKESIFIEPSSATTLAAFFNLVDSGQITSAESVVLVATGAGLKDPQTLLKVSVQPPTIEPLIEEVEKVLKANVFTVRTLALEEKETILFDSKIDLNYLNKILDQYNLQSAHNKEQIVRQINSFIDKGKKVSKSDLMYILEETQKDSELYHKALIVNDFSVKTSKLSQPEAQVFITFNNEAMSSEAKGTGPVDAVINAFTKLVNGKGNFHWKLIDYDVQINNQGTDAVVEVTMVLEDDNKNKVVEVAASPDIIVASVNAFEKGYNALFWKNHN